MANELLFFMEVLVGGLLAGTMYSLVALGFVLIFKASAKSGEDNLSPKEKLQQHLTFHKELWFFSQFLPSVVSCKILIYLLYSLLF